MTCSRGGVGAVLRADPQRARSLFDREVLDATRKAFLARRDAILSLVADPKVDAGGQATARAYVGACFDAIASDEAFYRPAVTRSDVVASASPDGSRPACGPNDGVPVGTPATEPSDPSGPLGRVELLDVFWHWADKCPAIRQGPIWIPRDAIQTVYPSR